MVEGISSWVQQPWPILDWVRFPLSHSEVWSDLEVLGVAVLGNNTETKGFLPQFYQCWWDRVGLAWPFILVEMGLSRYSVEGLDSQLLSICSANVAHGQNSQVHSYHVQSLEGSGRVSMGCK